MVEYKLLAIQHAPRGLVVMDQYVAGCDDLSRKLRMLLQVTSGVYRNEDEKLRPVSEKKFDPPKEISLAQDGANEGRPVDLGEAISIGTKVCKQ